MGSPDGDRDDHSARLAALEGEVAALRAEVAALRSRSGAVPPRETRMASGDVPHRPTLSERIHGGPAISGDEIESLVGRYGTLALAALVILMAVGAVIRMAVQRGLLTPEVRVAAGVIVAGVLAAAGLQFRRRGEVRYGGVLLALALAVLDLVAWGAGPLFHLVPTSVALSIVDVAAIALAALAMHDESEFLFVVAVGGALAAPFIVVDERGAALPLLAYGAVVLAGALRGARHPQWRGAFVLLIGGAIFYTLASAGAPTDASWYTPFLPGLFCTVSAAIALAVGIPAWRSELPRAYLAVGLAGAMLGWDAMSGRPYASVIGVALFTAAVTYAALAQRSEREGHWRTSALVLPFVSLGTAYAGTEPRGDAPLALALWAAFALGAWRHERSRGDGQRSGAHLLTAAVIAGLAITAWQWSRPLALVAGLAAAAVVFARIGRDEETRLPLTGVGVLAASAMVSAFDQLLSRGAYAYTPFLTRSSASAAVATAGAAAAGWVLSRGTGAPARMAERPVRLGVPIAFAIVWGRMELAHAFSPDIGAFLLTSYYAACGVGLIIAGRRLGIGRLRVAGLCLALFAAVKAIVEVTNIGSMPLRVSAYAAVGVFLLGAGYLYRERQPVAAG